MKNVFLLHTTEAVHYVTHDEKKNPYIYIYIKYAILLKLVLTYPIKKSVFLLSGKKQESGHLSH